MKNLMQIQEAMENLEIKNYNFFKELNAYTLDIEYDNDLEVAIAIQGDDKINMIRIMVPKLYLIEEEKYKDIVEFIMEYNQSSIIYGTLALGKTKDNRQFITYNHCVCMERGENSIFHSEELNEFFNYIGFMVEDIHRKLDNE